MNPLALSSAILAFVGWASYVPVNKVPVLRHTMWPTWAILVVEVVSVGWREFVFCGKRYRQDNLAFAGLFSFVLFIMFYFVAMRIPTAKGRPEVGQRLPRITVVSEDGQPGTCRNWRAKGRCCWFSFAASGESRARKNSEVSEKCARRCRRIAAIFVRDCSGLSVWCRFLERDTVRNAEVQCLVVSDPNAAAAESLHLLQLNMAKVGKRMAIPANIMVDEKGVVRWARYAQIVMDRPGADEVLREVMRVAY